jgi:hypothetical protein
MWNHCIAVAIVLCFAQTADAEWLSNLEIVGGSTTVVGSDSSCWVTLQITNTGTTDAMLAWQLVVKIAPADNATGTVSIVDYAAPPNYVFSSSSITSSSASPLGSTYTDFASDGVGTVVSSSGDGLIQLKLSSSNAVGYFNVVLVPDVYNDDTGSIWLSSEAVYDFVSADQIVASVNFGTAVPEPSSGLMLLSGVAALMLLGVARKRLRHYSGSSCD